MVAKNPRTETPMKKENRERDAVLIVIKNSIESKIKTLDNILTLHEAQLLQVNTKTYIYDGNIMELQKIESLLSGLNDSLSDSKKKEE